jgi:hypothetical protein
MEPEVYLIWLYCEVERIFQDIVGQKRLRCRGPMPELSDIEVITIELFAEYQGYGTDKQIWHYTHEHWHTWFPRLGSYKNFTKHCANLSSVKTLILQRLMTPEVTDDFYIVDGLPLPICKFARAPRCKLFPDMASYGYCAAKKETYYGFKGLLVINAKGDIRGFSITPASLDERHALLDMDLDVQGDMLGDKGFLGTDFTQTMKNRGIIMHTPLRNNMHDPRPQSFLSAIMNKRRYIETIIGKLIEQFSLIAHKARDLWRLSNKISRKLISYSFALKFHGSTQFLKT